MSNRLCQTPARICSQCQAIILGPVSVVEVSRYSPRGPEHDAFLCCPECCDRLLEHLGKPRVEQGPDTRPVRLRAIPESTP